MAAANQRNIVCPPPPHPLIHPLDTPHPPPPRRKVIGAGSAKPLSLCPARRTMKQRAVCRCPARPTWRLPCTASRRPALSQGPRRSRRPPSPPLIFPSFFRLLLYWSDPESSAPPHKLGGLRGQQMTSPSLLSWSRKIGFIRPLRVVVSTPCFADSSLSCPPPPRRLVGFSPLLRGRSGRGLSGDTTPV